MTKFLVPIVLPADPTAPMQAATKQYVDNLSAPGDHTAVGVFKGQLGGAFIRGYSETVGGGSTIIGKFDNELFRWFIDGGAIVSTSVTGTATIVQNGPRPLVDLINPDIGEYSATVDRGATPGSTATITIERGTSGDLPIYSRAMWSFFVLTRYVNPTLLVKIEARDSTNAWATVFGPGVPNINNDTWWSNETLVSNYPPNAVRITFTPAAAGPIYINEIGVHHINSPKGSVRFASIPQMKQYVDASGSPISQWNAAWGVVAQSVWTMANTPLTSGAYIEPANSRVTWTPVAGRRYRCSASYEVGVPNGNLLITRLNDVTASTTLATSSNALNASQQFGLFIETGALEFTAGTPRTIALSVYAGTTGASIQSTISPATVVVEDVGPVSGALAVPNPTPAWIAPSYSNSWTNAPGWMPLRYRKVGDRVYIEGHIYNGTGGATAFTLPSGYRPPNIMQVTAGVTAVGVNIDSSGTVTPASNAHISLFISFSVTA